MAATTKSQIAVTDRNVDDLDASDAEIRLDVERPGDVSVGAGTIEAIDEQAADLSVLRRLLGDGAVQRGTSRGKHGRFH
jgi:hypothetical protein